MLPLFRAKDRYDYSNVQHFVLNHFVNVKFVTYLTAIVYEFRRSLAREVI